MIHVFTGPTLAAADPALANEQIRTLPPVRHGDLFDPLIADTDTVVIVDGVYHHAPALRHKEIIWALDRGVRVIGAASIGALRAAELAPCGMVGVGAVFAAYARGELDGDDEVAVAQAVGGDNRAFTWPLVNLRHTLQLAEQEEVIDADAARRVLDGLARLYYAHRSLGAVRHVAREAGAPMFGQWLTAHRVLDPYFGDLKRSDALAALETALRADGTLVAPRPGLVWRTRCFRHWANVFAAETVNGVRVPTRERVGYQQVFDPGFPDLWWRYLHPGGTVLKPSALACAAARPEVDLTDPVTVSRLLANETPADVDALTLYLALNQARDRAQCGGFRPETVRDDLARTVLAAAWSASPDALADEAWKRGFHGEREAVAAVKPFVLGVLADREGS
ncbi:TfuA-like protein [Streptomyces sp. NPDC057638]|uniref:TfuA-like protein n=1 Tax=Streptomyces sp. NPDC057638 TaxID=3346190 RepID=UPI003678AB55